MDGRNDRTIVNALETMAQSLWGKQNQAGNEFRWLGKFHRNNPPTFKGIYDSEGAQAWPRDIEMIFWVMACFEV